MTQGLEFKSPRGQLGVGRGRAPRGLELKHSEMRCKAIAGRSGSAPYQRRQINIFHCRSNSSHQALIQQIFGAATDGVREGKDRFDVRLPDVLLPLLVLLNGSDRNLCGGGETRLRKPHPLAHDL